MAGQTITEKILDANTDHAATAKLNGNGKVVEVDLLLTHDVCGPPTAEIFKREFGKHARVWDPKKVVIIPDHYIYTKDATAARNVQEMRDFAKEQSITNFYDFGTPNYRGVCHVALPEAGHVFPGQVIFGTDSHTCTHGAFGTVATGIGNTTGAFIMGTGKALMNVPESLKFYFANSLPRYTGAKDLILQVIGDIGTDGADFKAMEFCGPAISNLGLEDRMTVCNMAIEAGGNGIIAPDERTMDYLERVGGMMGRNYSAVWQLFKNLQSDSDAKYLKEFHYDASDLEPVAACPHSPGNVRKVRELDVKLNDVYIGSCTGGKKEDFLDAAYLLHSASRKVAIPLLLVPATCEVSDYIKTQTIAGKTLYSIFEEAGADMRSIEEPSCAACLGGPRDTYGRINDEPNHTRASTTNRNFPKRMGSGNVYLVSPLTAAASALTGKLTDPREFM